MSSKYKIISTRDVDLLIEDSMANCFWIYNKINVDRTENIAVESGKYQTDTNSKCMLKVTRYLGNHEGVKDIPTFYILQMFHLYLLTQFTDIHQFSLHSLINI